MIASHHIDVQNQTGSLKDDYFIKLCIMSFCFIFSPDVNTLIWDFGREFVCLFIYMYMSVFPDYIMNHVQASCSRRPEESIEYPWLEVSIIVNHDVDVGIQVCVLCFLRTYIVSSLLFCSQLIYTRILFGLLLPKSKHLKEHTGNWRNVRVSQWNPHMGFDPFWTPYLPWKTEFFSCSKVALIHEILIRC